MSDLRLALVVTVDHYDNPGLRELAAPAADARALSEVLGDPGLGAFTVDLLHNPTSWMIYEKVDSLLADRRPSDLVLMHFSCHGLKDLGGELYLAATNTDPDRLPSTAVDATWISRVMQRSRAQRVVLLLDCCYGGAFERGVLARSGQGIDVGDQFRPGHLDEGRGRVVITASTAMEYAFEGSQLAGGSSADPSVFTGALVEGIRTGEADRDQDGYVALDELYDYVYDTMRQRSAQQTPCKWEFGLRGGLYMARNPHRRVSPAPLPQELLDLLDHPTPAVRMGAVDELGRLAAGGSLARAAAARLALAQLVDDDSRRVSASAAEALRRTAVRLAVSSVDFGAVPQQAPRRVIEVGVEGPPLALASAVTTSSAALRADLEDGVLRITWVPAPGRLDEVVTLGGPAGDARLRVIGEMADAGEVAGSRAGSVAAPLPTGSDSAPDEGAGPAVRRPGRFGPIAATAAAWRISRAAQRNGQNPERGTGRTSAPESGRGAQPERGRGPEPEGGADATPESSQETVSPGLRGRPTWQLASWVLLAVLVIAGLIYVGPRVIGLDRHRAAVQRTGGPPSAAPSATGGDAATPGAAMAASIGKPVVTRTITVGKEPQGVAVSPDNRTVYVANQGSRTLSIVDAVKRRVSRTVRLKATPRYVAVSGDGAQVYVSTYEKDFSGSGVAVIDVRAGKVVQTVPTGPQPFALAVAKDGRIWVPIHHARRVEVITGKPLRVAARVNVPQNPHGVGFSLDGTLAYTPDHESDLVSVIDTRTLAEVKTIPVGDAPHGLAVSPDGRTIFVTNYEADTVQKINTSERAVIGMDSVQHHPQSVTFASDGLHAYVVNEGSNSVSTLLTATGRVTAQLKVGRSPRTVAAAADGRFVYVTNAGDNTITVLKASA
jgi:YVTN family beta-propeller protein